MTASIAIRLTRGFAGYDGYWRFSELRSVQRATFDRDASGGDQTLRCLPSSRS
ncbi:hypothetical protein [Halomonas korlensis]|uniref:Uncharacterized protein n=1 Tax=Halomonas korlensis TaxID=463301 RepID=A0A1I7HEN9_9GAMM|nr:hypothetical protein [Halomonas korlensis]SFU59009.1 hypothetical protein SAMN04487955_104196 [Halomonas korlensis]